ncbi:putative spermidine/putrescine transport system substrate-binding protein [Rhodoligotrophos appendicifer]|uniref:ABC transporter substrate-binding protein n=1 Tax=Rhodoligotrophos appendicifer TaxID=987056 RepID=UPI0011862B5B|nr:ABC transporter substrate-binding protein [Rhodoligotrophos appendicifer]
MNGAFQTDCFEILKQRLARGEIGRRDFLKGIALLGVAPLALKSGMLSAQEKQFVLVNWGGDAIKAFDEAFAQPFAKASGLTVKIDGAGPTEGAIQAQVTSGKVSWDVVDADIFSAEALGKKGFVQKINFDVVKKDKILEGGWNDYAVANYYLSYVLVYDKEKYGDTPPKTWADFFDVEKFPGKRTMYKWMVGNLEAALLADGVAPDKLYPLDVDRAFKKIKAFSPNIAGFWGSGAESQQLMLEGEASMGLLWNTRAKLIDKDSEGKITYGFAEGFLGPSSWAIMKDNPAGAEAANAFIASAQDPAGQVKLLELLGNGPANPAAAAMVPAELKKDDCTQPEAVKVQHQLDQSWYVENYSATLDKFLALISS